MFIWYRSDLLIKIYICESISVKYWGFKMNNTVYMHQNFHNFSWKCLARLKIESVIELLKYIYVCKVF